VSARVTDQLAMVRLSRAMVALAVAVHRDPGEPVEALHTSLPEE
jgi:hypothetical protein